MLYDIVRKILCPFNKLVLFVPKKGKFLDVGCGHGTFARILMFDSSKRRIVGIDPSLNKIEMAKKLSKDLENISFENKYLNQIQGKFDCITIVDVLYLLPNREKIQLLKEAKKRLKKNGTMLIKTDNADSKLLFSLLKIEEKIMVKILKQTYTDYKDVYYSSPSGYKNIIEQAGLRIISYNVFRSIFPYLHPTYVVKKQ